GRKPSGIFQRLVKSTSHTFSKRHRAACAAPLPIRAALPTVLEAAGAEVEDLVGVDLGVVVAVELPAVGELVAQSAAEDRPVAAEVESFDGEAAAADRGEGGVDHRVGVEELVEPEGADFRHEATAVPAAIELHAAA